MRKSSQKYLNSEQLAKRLGVSVLTLIRWRKAGKGPKFARIGRFVRYYLEDVKSYEKSEAP